MDITIRNELEFEAFCMKGMFQCQHMSSILALSFYPLFNLTSIFTCVARLVQREILSQEEGVMSMSQKVNVKHYRVLYKLVKLYFAIQYLELPRYLLVRDVPVENMRNVIFGFSDGSLQFSTSCIYLLSYDCKGNKYSINLVSTLCKLADKTKSAKILDTNDLEELEKVQSLDTVPKREAHGLVLACNGAFTLTKLLKRLQLNLEAVYILMDSISQILA